jgi:hypothetical protein
LEHGRSSPCPPAGLSLSAYVLSCCCNASCKAIARDTSTALQLFVSCMVEDGISQADFAEKFRSKNST